MSRTRTRLLRTTVFRLSLLYACAYSVLSATGMGLTYWFTARYSEAQVDTRLRLETDVLLKLYHNRALPALVEAIQQRSQDDGERKVFFYLLERAATERRAPGSDAAEASPLATRRLSEVFRNPAAWRVGDVPVRVLTTDLGGGYRLVVGRDLNDERALLDYNLKTVLVVIGVTFLLALLGSVVLGRKTLRRIDAVSQTASAIIGGNMSRRVPITGRDDEFDELGRIVNAMLERIERLLVGMRQVTDNVAHDLRSPLNRLRNRLEVTLLEAREPDEYRSVLEQTISDADGLLQTFNALLGIARAEAGVRRDWVEVDLVDLVENMADLYGALAEEKGIDLSWSSGGDCKVLGDRHLLALAVSNLLDNALKYTPSGGRIEVRASGGDVSTLEIADSGPGIPADERERVLERFVRLDNARSTPGNGLGLSLVKAVAKLHGAEWVLADNQPGLRVTLRFRQATAPLASGA